MAKNSIFDLADKFGYESPFKNDWINEDYQNSVPTISFKGKAPKKIETNIKTLVEFRISGEPHFFKNYISVEILIDGSDISFSTTKWTNVDNGWTLKTYVIAKTEGMVMLNFKINNHLSNSLPLTFIEKREKESTIKELQECLCKKTSWTSKDLNNIVIQLRELDSRKIKRNPLDQRGNRTYIDSEGNVIPSTETGRKPPSATKLNIVLVDLSLFDDVAEDNKINGDRLFINKANGQNIDSTKANYNEFSKQLNRIFKEYNIDTCLRKIHFIAQIYQETNRFRSTFENVSRTGYLGGDFYQGRGMKQITHDYNYLDYYSFIYKSNCFDLYMKNRVGFESVSMFNRRTNNKFISIEEMNKVDELVLKISTDIYYACDSAGWYWSKNKINEYADKDDILGVSAKINNPSAINKRTSESINGYEERKKYYELLKIIFDYENC